ncbi:MAG TPA: condensation domain-containing protein, partial [Longimicrobium sp.]|nr:condensation domain-containing protein [Longimicrobium sp.]
MKRALLEKRLRGAGRKSPAGGEIATGGEGVDRPLSFTQEQVWYLNQLQPDSPYYNVPAALRLAGALDVDALHRTLSEIVRRHAVLRSRVSLTGGEARARVLPAAERVELPVDSLEHLPHEEREEEARRIVAAEARRPFDLVGGPPCRFRLIRMGPGDHAFTVNLHFMAVDAWSWGVFFHELDRIYEAYERGLPSPFPELPLQYPDFAEWQRNNLQAEVLERHLRFWRERLAGAPEALELPTDLPRPALPSFRGDAVRLTIPEALTAAIRERSAREGTTPFAPILAAYAVALAELAGDREVMVGSLTTTRTRTDLEGLIGLFLNAQPLRIRMEGAPTFREVMGRVRQEALEAYEHRELPLEKLTAEVVTNRDLSRHPLFQAAFVYQAYVATNAPAPRGVGSVGMRAFGGKLLALVHSGTSKYDLTLALSSATSIYDGQLEYSTDLFHPSTAEALVERFMTVLAAGIADPDRSVWELAPEPMPEPRAPQPLAGEAGLAERFARLAQEAPDAAAVREAGRSWSFAELQRDAERVAGFLRSRGVRRVAVVAPAGAPA